MGNVTDLDWVAFRSHAHFADVLDALPSCFRSPQHLQVVGTGKGWNGYKESRRLLYLGKPVGLVAWGGASMRGWCQTNLTGDAMDLIAGDTGETLTQLVEDLRGQFKRVDIARTTFDGSVSIQTVEKAHAEGGFCSGGRNPKMKRITSTCETDGETCYIGKRDQPKFCRAYEKGWELVGMFGAALDARGMDVHSFLSDIRINDALPKDIFRVEVEFKPDPEFFPPDILMNRDTYFAGAYPYLATLVQSDSQPFKLTAERKASATMDAALNQVRRQFGDVLFTALMLHHGDMTGVWDKIVGKKHSRSLIEAGVLLAMEQTH